MLIFAACEWLFFNLIKTNKKNVTLDNENSLHSNSDISIPARRGTLAVHNEGFVGRKDKQQFL